MDCGSIVHPLAPAVRKVVRDHDPIFVQQPIDQMRSDETPTTSHEHALPSEIHIDHIRGPKNRRSGYDRYGTPGVPPRPSGIKCPDRDLPRNDRLAFGVLSKFLTAVRGLGYYEEYRTGERREDLEGVPRLET